MHVPPQELNRGVRSLFYHGFAATPLIMLAFIGKANGYNLYPLSSPGMTDSALQRLVNVVIA